MGLSLQNLGYAFYFLIAISFMCCSFGSQSTGRQEGAHRKEALPLGENAIQGYLSSIKNLDPTKLGFDPNQVEIETDKENAVAFFSIGSRRATVYYLDINHDGTREYVTLYFEGGSLKTSGILNVVTAGGKVLDFSKVVSLGLWNRADGDLSQFHLWLAQPPIIRKNNQFVLRYLDRNPSLKITEYIWSKDTFVRLGASP